MVLSYYFMCTVLHSIAGVKTDVLQPSNRDSFTTADSSLFGARDFPQSMTLQIPAELIQMFANSSGRDDGGIRVVAAVYYDAEDLLPSSRPQMNE